MLKFPPACHSEAVSDTLSSGMIRELVKEEIAERGWNLLKLSQESGVAYRAIHDWLSEKGIGTRGPSVENIEKILAVLNIRVTRGKPRKPAK